MAINGIDIFNFTKPTKKYGRSKKSQRTELLNGKVQCSCGRTMAPYTTKKNIYFKCENKTSPTHKANMPASVLVKHAISEIEGFSEKYITDELFPKHQAYVQGRVKTRNLEINEMLASMNGKIANVKLESANLRQSLRTNNNSNNSNVLLEEINQVEEEVKRLEERKEELHQEKQNLSKLGLTLKQFLELMAEIPTELKVRYNWDVKHRILNEIYSNFNVSMGKVVASEMNPKFGEILKDPKIKYVACGRAGRT